MIITNIHAVLLSLFQPLSVLNLMIYRTVVLSCVVTLLDRRLTTTVTKATSWLEIHTESVSMMDIGVERHLYANVSLLHAIFISTFVTRSVQQCKLSFYHSYLLPGA